MKEKVGIYSGETWVCEVKGKRGVQRVGGGEPP